MGFPNLLLNIDLILVTTTIFCIADDLEVTYRLHNNTIPFHYDIRLTPHLEEDTFYGETDVIIEILYASSNISLHSQELEINKMMTMLTDYNGTNIYKPMEHIHSNVMNILTLNFNDILSRGLYILHMEFVGSFSEGGFLKNGFMKIPYTDEEGDNMLATTYFQPDKARRMFPCWDEPALKATFNISVRHHQKYRVLSNMPMREQVVEQDDKVWTHFSTTPTMSTYLVGIVISNFVRVGNADRTINVWCRSSLTSQANFALNVAENFTSLLVQYTNSSEKVPKMDHVMVHNYPVNGMEHWGLIIYNESNVIYNASTDPTFQKRKISWVIIHELVHQWFGNLVTPAWWSNLWLSEGFAVFFEAYFFDKLFDWRAMDFLAIWHLHDSLAIDIGLLGPVKLELDHNFDHGNLFIDEVYDKAPVILRMLHHAISDEVFRKGIITYLATNQFRSVTPDDLWSAMQSALDESYIPHEDFKIKEVMDTWINQNRYPVLNVTRNYETGEVAITQKCVRATADINYEWWIPVTFAAQSNPDFSKTVPNHWIGPNQSSSFEVHSNDWIIVNVQQTAYCRVYYDSRNWQKIINYLNSDEYTIVHVLNRAQIIDDAYFFLLENQIDSSLFYNLTNYLSRERDYVAWHPMFRIFKRFLKYFSLTEKEGFKSHMVRIFDSLLQDIGYEENPDEDDLIKTLRLQATKWACAFGHVECKRMATVKLSEHLADPDTHKIPQWWRDWTYCFGLALANRTTWDKMLELYQQNHDKKLFKLLSCAENPDIITNYLNIIASNTTLFNKKEHYLIFKIILEKHARNDLILNYILDNFETIKPRSVVITQIIKNILWTLFSNEQLYKVKRFAEIHFHDNPDTLLVIEGMIEIRKNNLQRARDTYNGI